HSLTIPRHPRSTLFPYTTLFRSRRKKNQRAAARYAGLDDQLWPSAPDDLLHRNQVLGVLDDREPQPGKVIGVPMPAAGIEPVARDRKSTRLNSSHQIISYAAFCL